MRILKKLSYFIPLNIVIPSLASSLSIFKLAIDDRVPQVKFAFGC